MTRSDGLGATLFREDGALRFSETERVIDIDASARSGGAARVTLRSAYLVRRFGAGKPGGLAARVAGRRTRFGVRGKDIVLELKDLGAKEARIQIARE